MARQLLIGEIGSTTYSSGKLADTGLNIEVLSVADDEGPISWAVGDAQPDMFRIVQGTTSGPNVYSNWINPRNVIVYDGSVGEHPTASYAEINSSGASVVAAGANGDLELKFTHLNGEVEEFWSLTVDLSDGADATGAAAGDNDFVVRAAYNAATKPDWLWNQCTMNSGGDGVGTDFPLAANGGAVASATSRVRFYGQLPGSTSTSSGDAWTGDASNIKVSVVSQNDITTAVWTAPTTTLDTDYAGGDNGVGSYYSIKKMEDSLKGIGYGYYNRRVLPNTPDNAAVTVALGTLAYDVVTIVATKDGSHASGQIHGVDNLDEIFIAGRVAVATWTETANTCFMDKLNGIFAATTNFPDVDL